MSIRELWEMASKPSGSLTSVRRSVGVGGSHSEPSRVEACVRERSNFKKKFLRTCKIMVMHSNERGECDLRTLVDRQRKR